MRIQKYNPNSYDVLQANVGFPPGYFTIVGQQITNADSKKPLMIVVGGSNYITDKIDRIIQSGYDTYLLFYPTNKSVWVTGVFLASKEDCRVYFAVWSEDANIHNSFKKCFHCLNNFKMNIPKEDEEITKNDVKLAAWITMWLTKTPKIPFKDLVHLEDYGKEKLLDKRSSQISP